MNVWQALSRVWEADLWLDQTHWIADPVIGDPETRFQLFPRGGRYYAAATLSVRPSVRHTAVYYVDNVDAAKHVINLRNVLKSGLLDIDSTQTVSR